MGAPQFAAIRMESDWGTRPDEDLCKVNQLAPWYVDPLDRVVGRQASRVLLLDGAGTAGRVQAQSMAQLDYHGVWGTFSVNTGAVAGPDMRLAAAGICWRTSPCSVRLVGVDTGMIGPYGYTADVSRTFHCKPGVPSAEQRRLYRTAIDNLGSNLELIRAGMSFREFAERSWPVPEEFRARRYNSIAHGVGMGNEWPHIPFPAEWQATDPRDGHFEENMVMAIETCIGREDGGECVKLEDMVVVKSGTCQLLSTFPFEADLLI